MHRKSAGADDGSGALTAFRDRLQLLAVGRLKSKIGDMRGDFRAILLCKIASLREQAAGRLAEPADQRASAELKKVALGPLF
ncbi:MAG: hypothetical protein ACI4ML_10330 [Aristaeellaceae bacterium]